MLGAGEFTDRGVYARLCGCMRASPHMGACVLPWYGTKRMLVDCHQEVWGLMDLVLIACLSVTKCAETLSLFPLPTPHLSLFSAQPRLPPLYQAEARGWGGFPLLQYAILQGFRQATRLPSNHVKSLFTLALVSVYAPFETMSREVSTCDVRCTAQISYSWDRLESNGAACAIMYY